MNRPYPAQDQIDYSKWLEFFVGIEPLSDSVLEQMRADITKELNRNAPPITEPKIYAAIRECERLSKEFLRPMLKEQ